ncbi:myelin-oligodendrocyte glycoprotein-like [Epinephelus lanceolatus]
MAVVTVLTVGVTSQPITAVEGDDVTLQFPLAPGVDLSAYTVNVSRDDLINVSENDVHVYRHGQDHLQTQMAQYKDRTTFIHEDLTRGILTLTLSSVKLSDSGPYKVYVPKLDAGCVIDLSVVTKDQENVAPVEGPLWKIVFHVCGCVAVIVLATFLILLKSRRIFS